LIRFTPTVAFAFAVAVALIGVPAAALANGAFPDSQTVLTPADRPNEILLVTNFGVVLSWDGGTSWQWSCERDANAFGVLYQLGPAPRRRLFTVANDKLAYSDDGTCGFSIAGGNLAGRVVTDVFPHPTDADRVLAVGYADARYAVLASSDGGATFGPTLYEAAVGDGIGGVEIARSDPATIYVSMTAAGEVRPKLARTRDGGANWAVRDFFADLGPGLLRIIAVDSSDPEVVCLRFLGTDTQAVAVTRDGGATVTTTLTVAGNLTAFVRLATGTLLAAAAVEGGTRHVLYRSRNDGGSFEEVTGAPRIRALSERGGVVYAATDNFGDGYALGTSKDEGTSWRAAMAYGDIEAILPCLRSDPICQSTCRALAGAGEMSAGVIWADAVCATHPPGPSSGCGCAQAGSTGQPGERGDSSSGTIPVLVALALRRRSSRRRQPTCASARPTGSLCPSK
jgi:hypothetical protein